jgi:MFS superfamily sulfate permease-like transporter
MALAEEPDRAPLLVASLRGWRRDWLRGDLMAGLALAAVALPAQLATARLVGVPPSVGLVAFIGGTIGFALFGSNRFLSVGSDSTIATIFAGGLATIAADGGLNYPEAAAMLALLVGAILIGAAVLRAGWIADLLSGPVITGFLAGIAVHIIISQLPVILNVPNAPGRLPLQLIGILRHLPQAHPMTIVIGLCVLALSLTTSHLAPRVPGALLALLLAAGVVALLHPPAETVPLLGRLPQVVLHPSLPSIGALRDLEALLPLAFIVALVCMMQSAAVLRAYPSEAGGPRHVSRDFGGVGVGCVLAGMFGAFAVNASPPNTAVVAEGGGHTQLAGLTAVVLAGALALFGGDLLAIIPQAALGGLLVSIACRIFRVKDMARILRYGGTEILLVAASAGSVIVLPIQTGMLVSIVLSLLHSFTIIARPLCTELLRVPGTTVWWPPMADEASKREPGVLVFGLAAPINFTNASYVCRRLVELVAARPSLDLVVLEASGMIDIDYTGSRVLQQTVARLRDGGITVALARLLGERAQMQAVRTGLIAVLETEHVFRTVDDAVRTLRRQV